MTVSSTRETERKSLIPLMCLCSKITMKLASIGPYLRNASEHNHVELQGVAVPDTTSLSSDIPCCSHSSTAEDVRTSPSTGNSDGEDDSAIYTSPEVALLFGGRARWMIEAWYGKTTPCWYGFWLTFAYLMSTRAIAMAIWYTTDELFLLQNYVKQVTMFVMIFNTFQNLAKPSAKLIVSIKSWTQCISVLFSLFHFHYHCKLCPSASTQLPVAGTRIHFTFPVLKSNIS